LIASLGFLLLVSLAVTAIVEGIGKRLEAAFPDVTVIVIYVVNLVLTIGITTVLFGAIFKVLPDIKIKWKDIWPGAIATSLLFLIGKFAISFYISKSDVGSTYGAAGSLVILLLWIYYSSIILYFGAEFTRAYALHKGVPIVPTEYAEWENKPAIAGATPPSQQNRSGQRGSGKGKGTMPSPGFAMTRTAAEKEKEKSAGLGTLAMGLLLYYFNKRGE
jgi:membrane protein